MVQEEQVYGGAGQFEAADSRVVDPRVTEDAQVEPEVMGEQRANHVAV